MASLFDSISGAVKKEVDYGISELDKVYEAVSKIVDTGQTKKFTAVNKSLLFSDNAYGETTITNTDTGQTATIAPDAAQEEANNIQPETYSVSNKTVEQRVILKSTIFEHEKVVFKVRPQINESRGATYDPIALLHHPGEILKYQRTSARTWSFDGTLISRNPEEAAENLKWVNWIRAWVMPFYGEGTNMNYSERLGAPPPILTLSAYGSKMIGPVPVVLESYSINWPADVDYIQTSYTDDAVPFPAIVSVSLSLKEAYSPAEYSGFDLYAYKTGRMEESFLPVSFSGTDTSQVTSTNEVAPLDSDASYNDYENRKFSGKKKIVTTNGKQTENISSMSEIHYDEMGNVIYTEGG